MRKSIKISRTMPALPQVQPFPTVPICSEMHLGNNMDAGVLSNLSILLVNISIRKAWDLWGSLSYWEGEWIVIAEKGVCLSWVFQTLSSFMWTRFP